MTTLLFRFGLVFLLGAVVSCTDSDDRIGSMEDFCDGTEEVSSALSDLAGSTTASPDDLAAVRDALRDTPAPESLRADLDTLADVIDEVLVGLDGADLSDPAVLAEVQDRFAGLESNSQELQAAADRVFLAIEDCQTQ